ncbi:MAG TPA: hypothetical protein VF340_03205, partial [Methyloceanibacter sp.]
ARNADLQAVASSQYLTIFLAAGFAGGFIYWLLTGARARTDTDQACHRSVASASSRRNRTFIPPTRSCRLRPLA